MYLKVSKTEKKTRIAFSGDTSKLKKHQVAKVVKKLYIVMAEPRTWLKKVHFKFDKTQAFTFSIIPFARDIAIWIPNLQLPSWAAPDT